MSQYYRPLKNLYFQFIHGTELDGAVEWYHAAEVLQRRDFIVLVPDKTGAVQFKGYFETKLLRELPKDKREETIRAVLKDFARMKGLCK